VRLMWDFPGASPPPEQADDNAERVLSTLAEALAIRETPDVCPGRP
jgi:hypothetical protein